MNTSEARISPLAAENLTQDMRDLLDLPLEGVDLDGLSPYLATLVRHTGLYRRFAPFAGKLLVAGKLPARDRELAILRCAWQNEAEYEWGEHVEIAGKAGLTPAEIAEIPFGASARIWSRHDAAVLSAVDQLLSDGMIDDATWDILAERYDDNCLIEFPILVGAYQMIAYSQKTLRTPLPQGSAGLDAR